LSGPGEHGRRPLCADVSRESGEPLAATASRLDHWLVVEYRGLWGRDLLPGSGLTDQVKAHLRAQLKALPRSRLLFVRRPERRERSGFKLYFGDSPERGGRLFAVEVPQYRDLVELDFAGALRDGGATWAEQLDHPLLVVCTHGKRDRCCAKYGRPVYEELREQTQEDWVWQSTHVGGDRFAGNVVSLPDGLYYGRVDRLEVWALLDELYAGRIYLDRYRGRSCYPFPVQAAELAVRTETGLTGVEDLTLVSAARDGEVWAVVFQAGDDVHEIDVAVELGELTYLTCDAASPVRPRRFHATAHRVRAR
jgi:hypothetical protein